MRTALSIKLGVGLVVVAACLGNPKGVPQNPAVKAERIPNESFDDQIERHSDEMFKFGREVFRFDSFGSEAFWGSKLGLHQAIVGAENGGAGPGLSPMGALKLGLKVDAARLPKALGEVILEGDVTLTDPDTTMDLIRADAVLGVKGFYDDKDDKDKLTSVGITCALCHSTVDDSVMGGIGRRLDGWPNRDLDVGKIITLAPNLSVMAENMRMSKADLEKVLLAWGPGRYDAQFSADGIGFRPDGKSAATVVPAAYGLAGVNMHTYTGWGSLPYWNAYVATTQMHGSGAFVDPRLATERFPVAKRDGSSNVRPTGKDRVTDRLPALHFYQLAIPAPKPPKDSFNAGASARGKQVFEGKAKCASCHVPPLFTEPGWSMHTAEEIGIDDFQAKRSPEQKYRTTPLAGLFVRAKGGFYHDGRFADLAAVVAHYDRVFKLSLADAERTDLIEYLKSI